MFYYRDEMRVERTIALRSFLEAILNEFGASVCKTENESSGIDLALSWCKTKRLQYIHDRSHIAAGTQPNSSTRFRWGSRSPGRLASYICSFIACATSCPMKFISNIK